MRARSVVLLALFAFVTSSCGTEGDDAASPTPEPTLAVAATPEPTEEPSPTPEPTSTPTAEPRTTTAPAAPAPARCRNTTDKSCGAFRFDPAVTNDDPVKVKVTMSPDDPEPGDKVTFKLKASDPDSKFLFLGTYRFSKDGPGVVATETRGECPSAFGAWDAPKEIAGEVEIVTSHQYRDAGKYTAYFEFYSRSYSGKDHRWPNDGPGDSKGNCRDPLASFGDDSVTFNVAVPPTPTPTATA